MAEHMKQSQKELAELLTEYWKLRHATGTYEAFTQSKRADSYGYVEFYMETLANKLGMQVTST